MVCLNGVSIFLLPFPLFGPLVKLLFLQLGGKVTGGLAETIDSVVTSEYTSNHLKASQDKPAQNVIDGVVQGTEYMTRTVAHGFAGLIGDPYRGLKKGGVVGLTKGAVSGVSGAFFSPFIGALGL